MSEERLERIEKQVERLVGVVGNLVTSVTNLAEQQNKFAEQQNKFAEQQNKFAEHQNALAEQQRITSGQLADVAHVVIEMKHQQEDFQQETRENFEKLHQELRVTNRKVEWSSMTALDAQKRVRIWKCESRN